MKWIVFIIFTILLNASCRDIIDSMSSEKLKKEKLDFDGCQINDDDIWTQKNYIIGGCGNIVVYGFTDSVHLLVIKIDTALSQISEKCTIIDLSVVNPGVEVSGYYYRVKLKDTDRFITLPVCSDIKTNFDEKNIIVLNKIKQGTLYVTKSAKKDKEGRYTCTVKLENLLLFDSKKLQMYEIRKFVFYNVQVGWIAG